MEISPGLRAVGATRAAAFMERLEYRRLVPLFSRPTGIQSGSSKLLRLPPWWLWSSSRASIFELGADPSLEEGAWLETALVCSCGYTTSLSTLSWAVRGRSSRLQRLVVQGGSPGFDAAKYAATA